jgi:hypothetical protein
MAKITSDSDEMYEELAGQRPASTCRVRWAAGGLALLTGAVCGILLLARDTACSIDCKQEVQAGMPRELCRNLVGAGAHSEV